MTRSRASTATTFRTPRRGRRITTSRSRSSRGSSSLAEIAGSDFGGHHFVGRRQKASFLPAAHRSTPFPGATLALYAGAAARARIGVQRAIQLDPVALLDLRGARAGLAE